MVISIRCPFRRGLCFCVYFESGSRGGIRTHDLRRIEPTTFAIFCLFHGNICIYVKQYPRDLVKYLIRVANIAYLTYLLPHSLPI